MDDFDHKLIALLRQNSRLSVAVLADLLGKSRGTIQNRLQKLVNDGIILNFTVTVQPSADPSHVRAITLVAIEGEKSPSVIRTLQGLPEVAAIHSTNGRWDLVIELSTDTLENFDKALNKIRKIKGIANSETNILLSTHAARPAPASER